MNAAVRIVIVLVAVAFVIGGFRVRAVYRLEQRIADFRVALEQRGLAAERGMASVPSEQVLRERVNALAAEFELEPSAIETSVERNADPIGAARLVAGRMGEVEGQRDVDEQGNLVRPETTRLTTTLVEIRVHVHGEGFLCTADEDLIVRRNLGLAMR